MSRLLPLLILCSAATTIGAVQPKTESLTTVNGEVYERARIQRVEPDGITYRHSWGITKIAFTNLPESVQQTHGYDPERAAQYRAAQGQRDYQAWHAAQDRTRADREREREILHEGHRAGDAQRTERQRQREAQDRQHRRQAWDQYDRDLLRWNYRSSKYRNNVTSAPPPQPPRFPRPPPESAAPFQPQ